MNELITMLRQLEGAKFYGSLEVKMEAGHVVLVRKTETLKPASENRRDNRGANHETYS